MPLMKLSRINKGGDILINTDHILFVEVEAKTTTVHMAENLLFSVEEPLDYLAEKALGAEGSGPGRPIM
jgi:DNA-binding LytR/AlgR family response regulator